MTTFPRLTAIGLRILSPSQLALQFGAAALHALPNCGEHVRNEERTWDLGCVKLVLPIEEREVCFHWRQVGWVKGS
jgi:hypothetical protein